MHRLRSRRQLAVVRELWRARDALARKRDVSPGRVLPDTAVVEAAAATPRTTDELLGLSGFRGPSARRHAKVWLDAVTRGRHVAEAELPPHSLASDAPPPPRAWADRDPDAAARLAFARARLADLSERWEVPVENLLTPDTLRRVLWSPPAADRLEAALTTYGARPWQVDLTAPVLREALTETVATRAARELAAAAPDDPTAAPDESTA
jgi:ribonuclease D